MALLQLEPVPWGCSPGVVLAFVCDHTGLKSDHIGKITILGKTAIVEVPDERATQIVPKLDGRKLAERPVRVHWRNAKPQHDDHFADLARLLALEATAEQEALRRAAQADDPNREGTSLGPLQLTDSDFGLGGRLLLMFTPRSGRTLPPNRLQPGSPVLLNHVATHRRMPTYRGVVYERDYTKIGVAFEPIDDDLDDDADYRLDMLADEASRLRQQEALRRVATAKDDRLEELRSILLGEQEARVGPVPPIVVSAHLNEPQADAVRYALAARDVAIIHGPPGTGKTTTLVEIIRHAVALGQRVLACAPSNHAVDHLLAKLLEAGERPVRIGHPARVDEALRERTLDVLVQHHPDTKQARKIIKDAHALFRQADKWTRAKPAPGEKAALRRDARQMLKDAIHWEILAADKILDEARIVCGTLTGVTSDILGPRRYDLVVIDEAAQSTEPACWIPILRADKIILAGDHEQLPPTILSPEAAEQGLAISLMERLVRGPGATWAKILTVQHRMHEAIMAFSNGEFYGGQLVAHASVAQHVLAELPNVLREPWTEQPVRFIDTAGASYDEELEEGSLSRRNPQEAHLATAYVRKFLAAGVSAAAIGVITPYRAQVRLLQELLADVPAVEIDSVDGFQGREKEAIIISMVRCNHEGQIGFLADTRRTNVAFTRARRSLVIIGDSATLANDPFYQRLIAHMEATQAYVSVWEE